MSEVKEFVLLDGRLKITWSDIKVEASTTDIDLMGSQDFLLTIKVIVPKELGSLVYNPKIVLTKQQEETE